MIISREKTSHSPTLYPAVHKSLYHVNLMKAKDITTADMGNSNPNLFTHCFMCPKYIENEKLLLNRKLKQLDIEKNQHLTSLNNDMKIMKKRQEKILTSKKLALNETKTTRIYSSSTRSSDASIRSSISNISSVPLGIKNNNAKQQPIQKFKDVKKLNLVNDASKELNIESGSKKVNVESEANKSPEYTDFYEIKHVPSSAQRASNGFSKTHLLDVYLGDQDQPSPRKHRLPSIVDLYKHAYQLSLIEKFNPTTRKSFRNVVNEHIKSEIPSLTLSHTKLKKMSQWLRA